jgi:tRNA-Thr(GGU) m(6)t(6)A37 methyltransferase TsaA
MEESYTVLPIGRVTAPRKEAIDDQWGGIVSAIEIDARFGPEALQGLEAFSHLEVIFLMHLVPDAEISSGARRPRGRSDWPEVGIFAQRAKGRPNRLGLSRCRLVGVSGRTLTVRGLDAIDGTPVLDLKPYLAEFGPIGEVRQPSWATELMARYYDE